MYIAPGKIGEIERTKNTKGLYQNHMHNFIQFRKCLQSFKTIEGKLQEELRLQDTQCPYTLVAFHVKKETKFTKQKKREKMSIYYTKTTCTSFSFHAQNICKVSKQSRENCKKSCAHKVRTIYILS